MPRRATGSVLRALAVGAAVVLLAGACSGATDPKDAVTKAVLEPQALFTTPPTTECPSSGDAAEGQPPQPQAVCIVVENTGDDLATYSVAVSVQDKDDAAVVYSQVVINTSAIPAGEKGAAAVAAPGAERVVNKPTDEQEAAGAVPAADVRLNITQVTRQPA